MAAADGSIDDTEIINETDNDGDGKASNFDIRVEADTRVSEFGYAETRGEPMFNVTVGNETTLEVVERTASGTYEIPLDGLDIEEESGPVTVTVRLVDRDVFTEDDLRAKWTKTVQYEPVTEDYTEQELARQGIESLDVTYTEYKTRFFNAEFWMGNSAENVRRAAEAANPVPTTKRGAAIEGLSRIAGGPATTTWTAVQTGVWSGIAFVEWKMGRLLTVTNSYGEGSYNRFHTKLSELQQNTRDIRNAETDAQLRENVSTREELLRELYETEQAYRANVKDLAEENTGAFEVNERDYNLFKSEFDEFETHLIADYYWTQMYLNSGADEYTNLTDAVRDPPKLSPTPEITSVSLPESATVGEPMELTVEVTNNGVDAPFQSLAVSFPDAATARDVSIKSTDFENQEYSTVVAPGEDLGAVYGTDEVTASYPLAEVGGRWAEGETKTMTLEVTPKRSGEFTINVKSVAQDGGWTAAPRLNSDAPTDQQSEHVKQYTVSVDGDSTAPSAAFEYQPENPATTNEVTFDASASQDPDGTIAEYAWDFDGDGQVEETTSSPSVTHTYQTAGERAVTVTVTDGDGANGTAVETVTVADTTDPEFAIEILEAETPVKPGGSLDVTARIDNTGETVARDDIVLTVPGVGTQSKTLQLQPGDWTRETFSIQTQSGDTGDYEASLTSAHETTTVPVSVRPSDPPNFAVEIEGTTTSTTEDEPEHSVVSGAPLRVVTTLTNTDAYAGNQTVSLVVRAGAGTDGELIGQTRTQVQLDAGESTERVLPVMTGSFDPDYAHLYQATMRTEKQDEAATLQGYILPDSTRFAVAINDTNRPVEPGEQLNVTADIENEGYSAATQPVSLNVSGLGETSTTVRLDSRQSKRVTLSLPTDDSDRGAYDARVASENESVTVPINVFATSEKDIDTTDLSGSGTASSPYVITNASALQAMEDDPTAHYVLADDIDATETEEWNGGAGFDPIGESATRNQFRGSFDGNGHTIRGLTIDRPDEEYVGVFGYQQVGDSTIENVTLTETTVTGDESVGGLVGFSNAKVYKTEVSGTVTGDSSVGGLAGFVGYGGSVRLSAVSGTVSAIDGQGGSDLGGLVGHIGATTDMTGSVEQSYSTATVDGGYGVGGLVGVNSGSIRESYATGTVTGSSRVGGLVGNEPESGRWPTPTAEQSYWDTDATGQSTSAGGTGLATGQLSGTAARGNLSGFTFDGVWDAQAGQYPRLDWQADQSKAPPLTVVAGPDKTVTEGESVSLTGDVRTTDERQPTYSWSIASGEGTLSGSGQSVTYNAPSNVAEETTTTIEVQVSAESATVSDTVNVTVTPGENTAPTARLSYVPQNPTTGDWLVFNGFESEDPDGEIQSYQWTFDGEQPADTVWGVGSGWFTDHHFDTAGNHTVALTVTDDDGASDTVSKTISVEEESGETVAVEMSAVEMRITDVTECGLTCRDVSYAIENPTNRSVDDLTADMTVTTGSETVWQNERTIGDVHAGETVTLEETVEFDRSQTTTILDNDGAVTITVELQSANETRTLTFDREF
ncbi:PKD domain-containing protein [Salinibaculum salinum]|uniref:PKD domain-containing protein n=1 Tax=Salinibaculum salinum TaxID=3131996 RepID=UPI0030EF9C32